MSVEKGVGQGVGIAFGMFLFIGLMIALGLFIVIGIPLLMCTGCIGCTGAVATGTAAQAAREAEARESALRAERAKRQAELEAIIAKPLPALPPKPQTPEEPDLSLHVFKDLTGDYTIRARYVQEKDGFVQLEKEDGEKVSVEIAKLSFEDQEFIRKVGIAKTHYDVVMPRMQPEVDAYEAAKKVYDAALLKRQAAQKELDALSTIPPR